LEDDSLGVVPREWVLPALRAGRQCFQCVRDSPRQELLRHQELKRHPVLRIGFTRLLQENLDGQPRDEAVAHDQVGTDA